MKQLHGWSWRERQLKAKVLNERQGKGVVIVEQLERGGEHHEFHVSRVFKGGGEMVE